MGSRAEIRVFRAEQMPWFYFHRDEPPEGLKRIGLRYVGRPSEADIIIAERASALRKFGREPTRFAIWTAEPRFDLYHAPLVTVPKIGRPVHVMNVHTGTLYRDNYWFLARSAYPLVDRDDLMRSFVSKPDRAVMLATYRSRASALREYFKMAGWRQEPRTSLRLRPDGTLLRAGENIDLNRSRQDLALRLYRRGACDIYGRLWPKTVRISGKSRRGNWIAAKKVVLANYRVNIAYENTIVPHYVTEKLWDAIAAACLPVYHGAGNCIYDDFPKGSFIEAAGKTTEAIAEEIASMTSGEASDRFEACLDTYLRIIREGRQHASEQARLESTVAFLQEIMDAGGPAS